MVSRRSWVEQIMGLPISVLARGEEAGSESADVAVRKVFAELIEVDRVFSPYKADSAVSLLGRGGAGWVGIVLIRWCGRSPSGALPRGG